MKLTITQNPIFLFFSRTKQSYWSTLFWLLFVLVTSNSRGQIAQRGSATTASAATTNNTTLTINKPSGVVAGDVLLFSVVQNETDNDNGGLSSPTLTGWTLVKDVLIRSSGTSNNNDAWFGSIYYRVADGTEGSNFSLKMHARCDMAIGSIAAFSGVACNALKPDGSSGGPFDIEPGSFRNSNSQTATANSVTVANSNAAVIMIALSNNDYNYNSWSNSQTELFDITTQSVDDASVGGAWRSSVTSGSTGNGTVTLYGSAYNSALFLVLRRAPSAGTLSGTQTLCSNGTTTLSSTVSGGTWSSSATGIATIDASTGAITGVDGGTATMTYTVTGSGGCTNATATRTVTVTDAPSAGTLSGTQTICSNGTTTLSSTVSGGTWSSSATGIATINASTGVVTGVDGGTATMTYTVTGSGGCANATATRTVTVTDAPSAGTLSGTQTLCSNGTTTLSSTVSGGTWSSSATGIATIDASTGAVTGVDGGTATMTYTVTGSGGCANATATRTVTVTDAPSAGTLSGTQTLCSNGTTTLSSNVSGGTWSSSDTGTATINASTGVVTGVAGGTATMTYTVTGLGGCANATATRTVTVSSVPAATNTTICTGGSGSLTVTSSCTDITEQSSGPNNAGTGVNLTGSGSTSWSNPGNITAAGSPYATVAPEQQGTSNYLKASNYGFSIPANAIINGIELTIQRSSTQSLGTGNRDDQVRLVKNNVLQATDKSSNDVYPTTLTSRTYGSAADLWGTTWTADDINNSGFGAVLSVFNTRIFDNATATVNFMQITVTYTIPGSLEWYTVSSGGTSIGSGSNFNPVGVANSGLANTNTAGTTSYWVACSTAVGSCRTKADFIINALPTVTSATGNSKTYTGITNATTVSAVASAGATIDWYDASTGGTLLASGTLTYVPTGINAGTYTVFAQARNTTTGCTSTARTSATLTITAKALTVTGATTANKEYDGNNTATITGGTLVGIVGSDVVTLTPSGTFAQTGVGTSIAITSTSTIGGANAGNYTLTQPSLTARNITAKALTVTGATTANKEYDGNTTATITGGTLVGIVGSDVVTLTPSGTFAQIGVGTSIAITSTSTIGGANAGNYTLTQPSLTSRNITAKALTVTGATTTNKEYDGNTTATVTGGTLVGIVGSDVVTLTPSGTFAQTGVGTSIAITSTSTIGGANAGNYTLTQPSLTARNITAKALTVTGATTANKEYDGNTTATVTGGTLVGIVGSDVVTLTPSGTFAQIGVGTSIAITSTSTIGGANAGNYTLTQPSLTSRNITAKALTVTGATTGNKVYDGNNTATITGGTLVGIVGSDVVTLTPSGTFAQTGVGTGIAITSTSTIGGANSGNYTLTQPSLTARNITAKALTVTGATTANKEYDGNTTATITGGTLVGIVGSDVVTLTPSGTFAQTGVGTGIAITSTSTIGGANSGNYTITQPSLTARNITAKALTVTGATTANKEYDGNTTATVTGGTLVGIVGSDVVTLTPSGTFAQTGVGTSIAITSTSTIGGANAGNYTLTQPSLTSRNITAKALTVTGLTGSNKVYDGNTIASVTGTASLNGLVLSETVILGGSPTYTFASANIGTAISISTTGFTISGSTAVNYSLIQPTLSANITVATPTVIPTVESYIYSGLVGGPNSATNTGTGTSYTFSYVGTGGTTYAASSTRPINAGTYTVTATVAADGNYESASSNATAFTIEKAATTTTVTVNGAPFVYTGSAQTPATVSVTGAGGLSLTPTAVYSNNTNAGTATASYSYAGDSNYLSSSDSADFTIGKATTTTTVTVNGAPFVYTGSVQTPATVSVTGAGGLSLTPTAVYSNNTNAGTATASYSYAGDSNYLSSSDSADFTIGKAATTTTVTVNGAPFVYTGSAQTPATVSVTGAGGLSLTPTAVYTNNTNVGTATASYSYAGDSNYLSSSDSANFTIGKAASVINITGISSYSYTGLPQGPTTSEVTGSTGQVSYAYEGILDTTYPSSDSKPTFAGTYQVVATVIEDEYYTGASSEPFVFTIAKVPSTISVVGDISYVYMETAQGPDTSEVTGSTGSVSYTYQGTGTTNYGPSNSIPTNAGTYQVVATLEADDIYSGAISEPFQFTIVKAASTITVLGDVNYTYSGIGQGPNTVEVIGSLGNVSYMYVGTGDTSYGPSATLPKNVGSYQVVVTVAEDDNYLGVTSDALDFIIEKAELTISVNELSKCVGTSYSFSNTDFSVDGLMEGDQIQSASMISLGTDSSATVSESPYSVSISDAVGSGLSNYTINYVDGLMVVTPLAVAGTIEAEFGDICPDAAKMLSNNNGVGEIQWEMSSNDIDFTPIEDANANEFEAIVSSNTYFRVVRTSGTCDPQISPSYLVRVADQTVAGKISGGNITVCSGASNNVVLTIEGSAGSVQWMYATTRTGTYRTIWGQTGKTLVLNNFEGNKITYYFAQVSLDCSTVVYTDKVTITVLKSVAGTISGAGSLCLGNRKTLSLTGSVGKVQWQSSTDNSSFDDIIGATNTSYTTDAITEAKYYRAVVTNADCESAITQSVAVTINAPLEAGIISEGNSVVCKGSSVSLNLSGHTSGTITWYKSVNYINSTSAAPIWTVVSGQTSANLNSSNLTVATWFKARVSNGDCSKETPVISVTIDSPSTVKTISGAGTICTGGSKLLTLASGSVGNIKWQSSSDNGVLAPYSDIVDATSLTYNASPTAATWYRVVSTNGVCSSVSSGAVAVTVSQSAEVGEVSATKTEICAAGGTKLSLSSAQGNIVWQKATLTNGVLGAYTTLIQNETSVTTGNTLATTHYRAVVSNGVCPTATSNVVIVKVCPTPVVKYITGAGAICIGSSKVLTLATGSVGSIQWQSNGSSGSTVPSSDDANWINIEGATDVNTLTASPTATTWYRVVVSSGPCYSIASTAVAVTVNQPTSVGTLPSTTTVCKASGTTLNLTSATGTITWQKATISANGVIGSYKAIKGNTTTSLDTGNLNSSTAYRVVVSSGMCEASTSNVAMVLISPAAKVATITGSNTANTKVCVGTSKILTLRGYVGTIEWLSSPTSTGTYTVIPGATESTYTYVPTSEGVMYFKVRMTSSACSGSVISKTGVAVYADSCSSERLITKEIVSDEFKAIAYPNPSASVFQFEVSTPASVKKKQFNVQVYDMSGRFIEQRQVQQSEIVELGSDYSAGMYTIIVTQGDQVKTLRVIKK